MGIQLLIWPCRRSDFCHSYRKLLSLSKKTACGLCIFLWFLTKVKFTSTFVPRRYGLPKPVWRKTGRRTLAWANNNMLEGSHTSPLSCVRLSGSLWRSVSPVALSLGVDRNLTPSAKDEEAWYTRAVNKLLGKYVRYILPDRRESDTFPGGNGNFS